MFRHANRGPVGDGGFATAAGCIPFRLSRSPHPVPCPFIPARAPVLTAQVWENLRFRRGGWCCWLFRDTGVGLDEWRTPDVVVVSDFRRNTRDSPGSAGCSWGRAWLLEVDDVGPAQTVEQVAWPHGSDPGSWTAGGGWRRLAAVGGGPAQRRSARAAGCCAGAWWGNATCYLWKITRRFCVWDRSTAFARLAQNSTVLASGMYHDLACPKSRSAWT